MTPTNIYLVKMTDSTVTGGDGNIFELHVHVVFGCGLREDSLVFARFLAVENPGIASGTEEYQERKNTLDQLSSINLSRRDLERNDMVLIKFSQVSHVEKL